MHLTIYVNLQQRLAFFPEWKERLSAGFIVDEFWSSLAQHSRTCPKLQAHLCVTTPTCINSFFFFHLFFLHFFLMRHCCDWQPDRWRGNVGLVGCFPTSSHKKQLKGKNPPIPHFLNAWLTWLIFPYEPVPSCYKSNNQAQVWGKKEEKEYLCL